jgi:hypothetical protein
MKRREIRGRKRRSKNIYNDTARWICEALRKSFMNRLNSVDPTVYEVELTGHSDDFAQFGWSRDACSFCISS